MATDFVTTLPTNVTALFTNANATNNIDFSEGPTITDAVLVINSNDSMTPVINSTIPPPPLPQYGEIAAPSLIQWLAVQFPVPGAPLNSASPPEMCPGDGSLCNPPTTTVQMISMRANVSQAPIPPPSVIPVIVSMTGPTNIPIFPNTLNIGLTLDGLHPTISPGAIPGDLNINLAEGFAAAFKILGTPSFTPFFDVEEGYFAPGSGADQGTRFLVRFQNVAAGQTVMVPDMVTGPPPPPLLDQLILARVDGTDASGAGGTVVATSGAFSVPIVSGSGFVVYEVTSANSFAVEAIDIPATLMPPSLGSIQTSVTFAPTSLVMTANGPLPEPRFVDTGVPLSLTPDGTAGDGTVQDDLLGDNASVTFPAGVVPPTTEVIIDVIENPPTPPPGGFSTGSSFVNIELVPEPAFPLPPPGLTLVLPVSPPLPPGTPLNLFRVDETTGLLELVLDPMSMPIVGTVDPDGDSATFTGIVELSMVVGFTNDPPALIDQLIFLVDYFVAQGDLDANQRAPLQPLLKNAKKALDGGRTNAAISLLEAFIEKVGKLIEQERVSEPAGQLLIDLAEQILAGL